MMKLALLSLICSVCSASVILGGFEDISTSDPGVIKATKFAVETVSARLDTAFVLKLIGIDHAQYQVVFGRNYNVSFTSGLTTCLKGEKYDLSLCKWNVDLKNVNAYRCSAKVFRNHTGSYDLLDYKCEGADLDDLLPETKPNMWIGGWEARNTTDLDVLDMAAQSVSFISSTLDTIYRSKLVRVVKAESQLVAGVKYHLVIDFGTTDCLKTKFPSRPLDSCKLLNQTHCTECQVEVVSQMWLQKIMVSPPTNCRVVEVK